MQFGLPNIGIGKTAILESLADIVLSLNVATLLMPTYSFSFCNAEQFDVATTPSSMGAFNEHMRIKHQWDRSIDPLMSNILYGKNNYLINDIGKNSVGEGSTFDLLSKSGLQVKFLFMGPRIHHCFTYMHYLEAVRKVPYRYNYQFTGLIKNRGQIYEDSFTLFIRDEGVVAGSGAKIYENILLERGVAKMQALGSGALTVVDLVKARNIYMELLELSPNFFIEEVFYNSTQSDFFKYRKMIAL
jgi:aminoglycoside 3-N-acetyltransferase